VVKAKIETVKAKADGLCCVNGREVYIPFVWKDEEVELKPFAKGFKLESIIKASSDRVPPFCPYYTKCGGCRLQHINNETYLGFKLDTLSVTLRQRGIDIPLNEIVSLPLGIRRRAEFSSVCSGKSHWFGFNGLKSKEVVSIKQCGLLVPEINQAISDIRTLTANFNGDVFVTLADNGLDILLTGKNYPDFAFLDGMSDFCAKTNTVRISWRADNDMQPETMIQIAQPIIQIADINLKLPAGCFLQPSREGQQILTDKVLSYLSEETKIADLFAGLGTFALPLSKKEGGAKVSAFDIFSPAMSSLDSVKSKGIKTFARDLFALPLDVNELDDFQAVVLDPPRSGAEKQSFNLAQSNVKKIVYVSCNPATFARDAKILTEQGGYKLQEITPVDQFTYSPHLELVALFEKIKI
jgi:23S rRNA (uracil1939-C5)-methyltransferase